jgi:gluconolactonase
MREICRGLQFPEGPIAMPDGSVLLVEIQRGTLSRVTLDGRITVVAECGGGPNGAAIGPDGRVYICNNGGFEWSVDAGFIRPGERPDDYEGGSIQAVDIDTGEVETLYTHCGDLQLRGPNDIVFDSSGGFWFTDLGKRKGREMDVGAVFYARPDGSSITMAIERLITPNGIGLSPGGDRLYVAETATAKLHSWEIVAPGQLNIPDRPYSPSDIVHAWPGHERLDSLAVDSEGNIVVATLITGCLTAVQPQGGVRAVVPVPEWDPFVTNVCFGGPDGTTAYITSSGLGRLYVADWHCPGLDLAY